MILVALGSNMNGPWGTPAQTVARALHELNRFPLTVKRASTPIMTEPFGRKNQPQFVNAAAELHTHLSPEALLQALQRIERAAGRRRGVKWGPRTLDLDILDFRGLVRRSGSGGLAALVLPHPGIALRSFVLMPLSEIAPSWKHPVARRTARELLRAMRP